MSVEDTLESGTVVMTWCTCVRTLPVTILCWLHDAGAEAEKQKYKAHKDVDTRNTRNEVAMSCLFILIY